ncbi:MAG: CPBP family intramembrane glutamic endopeptidase [Saprospiraceae bacterium]
MSFTSELISAILQVILLTIIPLIFFLFRKDKQESFFIYIGLYKPTIKSVIYLISITSLILLAGLTLVFADEFVKKIALSPGTIAGKVDLIGFNTTGILVLLINTIIKTSLSEEIFFRGFFGKRMIKAFGFRIGNSIQSILFGFVHLALFAFIVKTGLIPLILIFIFTGVAGWIIGYYKEKHANGSIIPGWIAHATGNTIATFILAFIV